MFIDFTKCEKRLQWWSNKSHISLPAFEGIKVGFWIKCRAMNFNFDSSLLSTKVEKRNDWKNGQLHPSRQPLFVHIFWLVYSIDVRGQLERWHSRGLLGLQRSNALRGNLLSNNVDIRWELLNQNSQDNLVRLSSEVFFHT